MGASQSLLQRAEPWPVARHGLRGAATAAIAAVAAATHSRPTQHLESETPGGAHRAGAFQPPVAQQQQLRAALRRRYCVHLRAV